MLNTCTTTLARNENMVGFSATGMDYLQKKSSAYSNNDVMVTPLRYNRFGSRSGRTNRMLEVDESLILIATNLTSKPFVFLIQPSEIQDNSIDIYQPYLSNADIIKKVKMKLGLPNKDIGDIFGVTRQTIYNYLKDKKDSSVNANNRERLLKLNSIIDDLSDILPYSPGALTKNYILDGVSLFDLLTAQILDKNTITIFAKNLSRAMNELNIRIDGFDFNENTLLELTKYS